MLLKLKQNGCALCTHGEIRVDTSSILRRQKKPGEQLIAAFPHCLITCLCSSSGAVISTYLSKLQQDKSTWEGPTAIFGSTKALVRDHKHKAFLPQCPAHKPPGANCYPEDMTKDGIESWVLKNDAEQEKQGLGF